MVFTMMEISTYIRQGMQKKIWSARDAHKYFTQEIENYEIDTEVDLKVVGYLLQQLRG